MLDELVESPSKVLDLVDQTEEDEDEESNTISGYNENIFKHKLSIADEIKKFKSLCKKKNFAIKPTWSGEVIPEITSTQLDMQIHSERILEIIARMYRKLEVVGCLPIYLKNNGEIIRKFLPPNQAEFIIQKMIRSSVGPRKSRKSSKSEAKVALTNSTIPGFIFDTDLEHVLNTLAVNKCLELIHQKKKLRVTDRVHDIIILIKKIVELASNKFTLTAAAAYARDKKLRLAYQEVTERMRIIAKMEEKLQEKSQEFELKIREKDIGIREYKTKIRRVRSNFKINVEDIVKHSTSKMHYSDLQSAERQQILSEQAKTAQQSYNTLLEGHLEKEKALRTRRFKVETQLASWITKFDQEIGDRQEQWDILEEGYENERKELIELQCQFKEQEEIYKNYKAQKDAEDEAAFAKQLDDFVRARSVKNIQRFWRAYKARKLAKKKARKDKAKAKAAGKTRK